MSGAIVKIFTSVLIILLLLAVFIPIFRTFLGDSSATDYASGLEEAVEGSSYLTIGINLAAIFFWTFGLDPWINLLILLPLRIIGLICLWYIIVPTK